MPKPVFFKSSRFVNGDLWDFHAKRYWVVVPTNIGWTKSGVNVMGAGLAQQAAKRFTDLPLWYGKLCQKYKDKIGVCLYNPGRLILVPSKPLNLQSPHLSWKNDSNLTLIHQSLSQLVQVVSEEKIRNIALSYVGCGNGGLSIKDVRPILKQLLDDRFTVVKFS